MRQLYVKKALRLHLKNENVLVWTEGEIIAIMRLERRKRLSSYGRRKRVSNNTFSTKKYSKRLQFEKHW